MNKNRIIRLGINSIVIFLMIYLSLIFTNNVNAILRSSVDESKLIKTMVGVKKYMFIMELIGAIGFSALAISNFIFLPKKSK